MSNHFYDEFSSEKPESFSEEVFEKTKRQVPKIFVLILLVIPIMFTVMVLGKVTVPDFTGWSTNDVMNWSKKNGPTIIPIQQYDLSVGINEVMSQKTLVGEKINKKDAIELLISKGADPNETIAFPDMKKMLLAEIQTWVNEYKLTGINIQYDYSDTIDKNAVINTEFIDGDQSHFIRKNRVKIFVSKGSKELSETLTMSDLYGKSDDEVTKWAIDNNIELIKQWVFHDFVPREAVINQSIPKESKFERTTQLVVTLSKGQPITVPEFTGLSKEEGQQLAEIKGITVFIKSVESTHDVNQIVNQDIIEGSEIDSTQVITLYVSKKTTTLKVPDFIGLDKSEASELAGLLNIKVFFRSVESTTELESVLTQSTPPNQRIDEQDLVILEISNGNHKIPDFYGLNQEEATVLAESLNIKVIFKNSIATHIKKGRIFKQSETAGGIGKSDDTIILEIAENTGVKIIDLTKWSKEEVERWATTHDVKLTILDVYDKRYKKGQLFDQNHKNIYLPESEMVIIYHALGDVLVESFIGKNKLEAMKWIEEVNLKGANLSVDYKSTSSSNYSKGQITNQTTVDDYLQIGSELTYYVCTTTTQNNKTVPSLINLTESEAVNWCNNNGISYAVLEKYHDSAASGIIFTQSDSGSVSPSVLLKLTKSIGRIALPDFTGEAKSVVETWLTTVNGKGGNLTVVYVDEASAVVDAGKIIGQSVTSDTIDTSSSITISVSTGN